MDLKTKKGSLAAVLMFAIILSTSAGVIMSLHLSRAPLYGSRVKRFHALKYAEAGLYEVFNRFRTGTYDGGDGIIWNANGWAGGVAGMVPAAPDNDGDGRPDVTIDGVDVNISLIFEGGRVKVEASVMYGAIDMTSLAL